MLCELWLILQPLLIFVVGDLWLAGDGDTLLHGRPRIDSLPPLVQVGELSQIYASEVGHVDPAEVRDVGDRVFVANEVLTVFEADIEDAVETFGLTDVSLGWVGNTLFGKSVETAWLLEATAISCFQLLTDSPVLALVQDRHVARRPTAHIRKALGLW